MHSPRKSDDPRPHPAMYSVGTKVGIYHEGKLVTGHIHSADEGGWIYVHWSNYDNKLPGYLRSTQAILL